MAPLLWYQTAGSTDNAAHGDQCSENYDQASKAKLAWVQKVQEEAGALAIRKRFLLVGVLFGNGAGIALRPHCILLVWLPAIWMTHS